MRPPGTSGWEELVVCNVANPGFLSYGLAHGNFFGHDHDVWATHLRRGCETSEENNQRGCFEYTIGEGCRFRDNDSLYIHQCPQALLFHIDLLYIGD